MSSKALHTILCRTLRLSQLELLDPLSACEQGLIVVRYRFALYSRVTQLHFSYTLLNPTSAPGVRDTLVALLCQTHDNAAAIHTHVSTRWAAAHDRTCKIKRTSVYDGRPMRKRCSSDVYNDVQSMGLYKAESFEYIDPAMSCVWHAVIGKQAPQVTCVVIFKLACTRRQESPNASMNKCLHLAIATTVHHPPKAVVLP
jgi:hypothetical protein